MAALLVLLLVGAVIAALDLIALRWGADSRPGIGDDHRRSVSSEGR